MCYQMACLGCMLYLSYVSCINESEYTDYEWLLTSKHHLFAARWRTSWKRL